MSLFRLLCWVVGLLGMGWGICLKMVLVRLLDFGSVIYLGALLR